jgi:hypothetical protein
MPTQSFLTFDTFFDAIRHASLRATLLGRDRGDWALTHLIANSVSVQWGQAGGKAVVEGVTRPGGLSIFLQTQGSPSFSGNGRRFDQLSTKSMTGHLLGAAGALEAGLTVLALRDQVAPPTTNVRCVDDECRFSLIWEKTVPANVEYAMTNSFGFGGTNASLIFCRATT